MAMTVASWPGWLATIVLGAGLPVRSGDRVHAPATATGIYHRHQPVHVGVLHADRLSRLARVHRADRPGSRRGAGAWAGRSARAGAAQAVEAVSIYWHFVDAVWVVVFSLVYLWDWCHERASAAAGTSRSGQSSWLAASR